MDQGEGGDKRGACEGRLWLRGWCLRTRSLREQINTAAPCTWTFLPLCRLVPSPFLSVFISRRVLRGCVGLLSFLSLPPSPSLPLACSPLLFYPTAILIALFLPRKLYVTPHAFYPYSSCFPSPSFSLFRSRSFPLPRSYERIQLVLPTYAPGFHPRVFATIAGGSFCFRFAERNLPPVAFFPKALALLATYLPQPSLVALTLYIVCVCVCVCVYTTKH